MEAGGVFHNDHNNDSMRSLFSCPGSGNIQFLFRNVHFPNRAVVLGAFLRHCSFLHCGDMFFRIVVQIVPVFEKRFARNAALIGGIVSEVPMMNL